MSSLPPPSPEPALVQGVRPRAKRPRYLVFALVGALIFGAGCWTDGCRRLSFYHDGYDPAAVSGSIHDDADRAHVESLFQRFVDIANAQKGRALPIGAATFVLGAALLILAARGLGGRSNSRSAIMQVVAAQAIVVAASYYALRDVENAENDWMFEKMLVEQRERLPPERYADVAPEFQVIRRLWPPAWPWLGVRSFASVLILLALTRPRSRAFFESATTAIPDP